MSRNHNDGFDEETQMLDVLITHFIRACVEVSRSIFRLVCCFVPNSWKGKRTK